MAAMQVQIQALLAAVGRGVGAGDAARGSNDRSYMEVAKPAIFNGKAEKVGNFITACKLFLRMKIKRNRIEDQVQ